MHSTTKKKPRVITPPQSPVSGRTRASLKRQFSVENLDAIDLALGQQTVPEDRILSKLSETLQSRYGI
jgi:hypothetical protein